MTDPAIASENDLLERIKAGDEEAFIQLYHERHMAIHRFALQISGSRTIAEDVTQEVFMALMGQIRTYDPARGTLSGYLYGMARNMIFDHMKRSRLDVSIDQAEGKDGGSFAAALVSGGDPLGDLTRDEAVESLRKAVLALPEHYREVVVLCDLHEMKYESAADVLGCAVGTVRSRLHRAREILVTKLSGPQTVAKRAPSMKQARCAL